MKDKETAVIKLGNDYSLEVKRNDFDDKNYEVKGTIYSLVIYYRKKYFVDISNYIKHTDYSIKPNDTIDNIKQKVFGYLNNKWVGVDDFQGCDFKVGDSMTLKEWKDWAINDRDLADDEGGYRLFKKMPLKNIIKEIENYWEISIKKVMLVR